MDNFDNSEDYFPSLVDHNSSFQKLLTQKIELIKTLNQASNKAKVGWCLSNHIEIKQKKHFKTDKGGKRKRDK